MVTLIPSPSPDDSSFSSVRLVQVSQLLQNSRQKKRSGYPKAPVLFMISCRGLRDFSVVFSTVSNRANILHLQRTFHKIPMCSTKSYEVSKEGMTLPVL